MRKIIGYLMFLANSEGLKDVWYALKEKLCRKYGVNNGYDIQYLPGKKCHFCDGTGIFKRYTYSGYVKEFCYKCTSGWYKTPQYVLLERIKVGNYTFHKPVRCGHTVDTLDKLIESGIPHSVTINGYIEHTRKKYGWLAFSILYIVFDWIGYIRFVKTFGFGWKCSWWLPKNYLHNFMHIKKNKLDSIPLRKLKTKMEYYRRKNIVTDDLPF